MEIGITLPQIGQEASPANIIRVAQQAEQLDYTAVWVLERLLRLTEPIHLPGSPAPQPMERFYSTVYDPIETLTYVAAQTERIKLGTSVIDALFHVPVVLARRLATLDHFSNGRVIAGFGQGYLPEEFATANVPTTRKGNGFGEFIAAVRAAWGPDPVEFHGKVYQIAPSEIGPKPVQPGGIPILIGAIAPESVDRAAHIADGINPLIWNWQTFEQIVATFRAMATAAGRDPAKLPIVVRANARIADNLSDGDRSPLSGSFAQIKDDLQRMNTMHINQVFFDLNHSYMPIADQIRSMEQLRKIIP